MDKNITSEKQQTDDDASKNTCSSAIIRGTKSGRGRGGGYRPKKQIQQKMQSLELNSNVRMAMTTQEQDEDKSKYNNQPVNQIETDPMINDNNDEFTIQQPKQKDSDINVFSDELSDSSSSNDNDAFKKKRCDFCGNSSHSSRSCPIIAKFELGESQNHHDRNKISCFYCKEEGHIRADCPKRKGVIVCYYCKKEGHIKADCPEKARQNAKKRERVKLNYTFRKSSQERDSLSMDNITTKGYEGPIKDENPTNCNLIDSRLNIIVPLPIPASQIKQPVQLRSKLSSDSEVSISQNAAVKQKSIVRSESSESEEEEEEGMDSCDEISNDENNPKEIQEAQKTEMKADEQRIVQMDAVQQKEVKFTSADECVQTEQTDKQDLITESIEIDGCIEFDTDDDESFYDCSESEENEGKRLKRIIEVDERYGEDGALLYDNEEIETTIDDLNVQENKIEETTVVEKAK